MENRLAFWFGMAGIVLTPWLVSCGLWGGGPGIRVKIDPQLIGTRAPKSRTEYSCYLVNVYGPGISPTVGQSSIGYYAPDCLKLGVSSRMVSGRVLANNGVQFSLPAGARRRIQVLGAVTSLGPSCENSDLSKLFLNEKKPELYELAAREVDLFKDTKVSFLKGDVIANPENLLQRCSSSKTEYNPANLTAVQIVTRSNSSLGGLQNFTLSSSGVLTKVQDIDLSNFPDSGLATRDGGQTIYWATTTGYAVRYAVVQPGLLVDGGPIGAAPYSFQYKTRAAFSDDGHLLFLGQDQTSVTQLIYTSTVTPYTPPFVGGFADISFLWVWGKEFHVLSKQGVLLKSYAALIPLNSPAFNNDPVLGATGLEFTDSAVGGVAVRGNSGIYAVIYDTPTASFSVRYYARSGTSLIPAGPGFPVNLGTSPAPVRLALDPTGKVLFVKYETTGNSFIKSYLLKTDGSISNQSALDFPALGFQDMVVDHRGKYLVMGVTNGGSGLGACPILESGLLDTCNYYPEVLPLNLRGVQSFPIF